MQKRSSPASMSPRTMHYLPSRLARAPERYDLGVFPSSFLSSKESLLPSTSRSSLLPNGVVYGRSDGSTETMLCGVPLKYISLVTLAIQNAALSIVMYYSRVSTPASKAYSPAAAVLLNELLKGTISFVIALARTPSLPAISLTSRRPARGFASQPTLCWGRLVRLCGEIFAPDCWKLSIPAILYVIQNSLQFVAISNLPVASFQVAYQMKIMTTAAFSVMLLGKRLSKAKWMALLLLAVGVAIVQVQTTAGNAPPKVHEAVGSAAAAAPKYLHVMFPIKGFAAVVAACFTSGLAGVYFEMVLKNSKADLWVRNVQLSLFSLIPALLPIIFAASPGGAEPSNSFFGDIFKNFGVWAWATVAIQVFGGLITAVVIKYSDNILKGFATSLSIILSFLASVALFDYHITSSFLLGATIVLTATWIYNQPTPRDGSAGAIGAGFIGLGSEKTPSQVVISPVSRTDPVLGEKSSMRSSASGLSSLAGSSQSLSSLLGLGASGEKERLAREREEELSMLSLASRSSSQSHFSAAVPSPFGSRSPSPYLPHSSSAPRPIDDASTADSSLVTLHPPPSLGQRRY